MCVGGWRGWEYAVAFVHQELLQGSLLQPGSEAGAEGTTWGSNFMDNELQKRVVRIPEASGREKRDIGELPALFKLCTPIRQMMTI